MSTETRVARLGDVARIAAGQPAPQGVDNFGREGLPFLRAGSLPALALGANELCFERVSEDVAAKHGLRRFEPGTVLFAKSGMSAKLGHICQLKQPAYVVSHIATVTPGPDLDGGFLRRWLEHHPPARLIPNDSYPSIRLSAIEDLRIALPSLPKQRRIAVILDKADAIRHKRQEAIGLTEDLLQAAFLRLVGPGNVSYFEWPVVRVEELTDRAPDSIRSGPFGSALRHSEFVEEGIAVLGIDNAVQNRFAWGERRFITAEKYAGLRRYAVKPGDVILTIMGTPGRSAVVPEDIPAAISTKHLATITVRRDLAHPEFLSNAFHRDPSVQRQIRSRHQGAIMPGLNLGLIKELEIRRPPIAVQERFAKTVGRIRAAERRYRATAEVADAFFQSLAQRAFRRDLDGFGQ